MDDTTGSTARVWPGRALPLGACPDGFGTNFSLFTSSAEGVDLCLFGPKGDERRIALTEVDAHCWHAYLPGVGPGAAYGYRVHGPWNPAEGLWHNPSKLLLDPYARVVDGEMRWDPTCFAYRFDDPDRPEETDDSRPRPPVDRVESLVRLGQRPPSRDPHARDGDLRAARQGIHGPPSRRTGARAGDLRRAGPSGGRGVPRRASASPPSSCSRSTSSSTTPISWSGVCGTTGATTRSASSLPHHEYAAGPIRSGSSSTWSAPCTPPGSR